MTPRHRPREWPIADLDVAAELRRQLDEAFAQHANLQSDLRLMARRDAEQLKVIAEQQAELGRLRKALIGEGEIAESENEPEGRHGEMWWRAVAREANADRGAKALRIAKLEQWLMDAGKEATKLQTRVAELERELGELTRQLNLSRDGERVLGPVEDF